MKLLHTFLSAISFLLLFTSCSTTRYMDRQGASRIRTYHFTHQDIPQAFEGFRIAFISDLHYKSTLREKGLKKLMKQIKELSADLLLMGGDYADGDPENAAVLFNALGSIKAPQGIIGVLGNHDYGNMYNYVMEAAHVNGIRILEHTCDTIYKEGAFIIIAGVKNPFDKKNTISPDVILNDSNFVVLLAHTPDYSEYGEIKYSDLILSGHTHGGQVTLFGLYAPVTNSAYGQKFRTGMKRNTKGIPILITNGIGTSRKRIRLFAPSEIIQLILHSGE